MGELESDMFNVQLNGPWPGACGEDGLHFEAERYATTNEFIGECRGTEEN